MAHRHLTINIHGTKRTLQLRPLFKRPAGGTWIDGCVAGYRFNALAFGQHAMCPTYELNGSRISKLWIQRLQDQRTVFNWDRGLDVQATDAEVDALIRELCAVLAEIAYPH